MPNVLTLVSVVGARPQFVKLAPISRAIGALENVQHKVVHTGQHYDSNMSDAFFEQLELRAPDVNLAIGSGSHAQQTGEMLKSIEAYLESDPVDAVLTYGDTNSTLAATLAASKIHVPVAHIEAGLRSFDRAMPEEINRLVADHCGDRLYAPTPAAMENLARESLADRAILSGDVMMDAIVHNSKLASANSWILDTLKLEGDCFGLVTIHRPVNTTADALRRLLDSLEAISRKSLKLVFPAHPRTRAVLHQLDYQPPSDLLILEPLSYLDNLAMVDAAAVVITDSGGVQKEAAFLKTPCLTVRNETEWVETIELGVNRLVGADGNALIEAVEQTLASPNPFDTETQRRLEEQFGKGDAGTRIITDCVAWLNQG